MSERCACGHLNETCTREPGEFTNRRTPPSVPPALPEFIDVGTADGKQQFVDAMIGPPSAPPALDVRINTEDRATIIRLLRGYAFADEGMAVEAHAMADKLVRQDR